MIGIRVIISEVGICTAFVCDVGLLSVQGEIQSSGFRGDIGLIGWFDTERHGSVFCIVFDLRTICSREYLMHPGASGCCQTDAIWQTEDGCQSGNCVGKSACDRVDPQLLWAFRGDVDDCIWVDHVKCFLIAFFILIVHSPKPPLGCREARYVRGLTGPLRCFRWSLECLQFP